MTDTVADIIIRVKNSYMARHDQVTVPASGLREHVARVLVETGYLANVERVAKKPQDELILTLRYINGKPAMTDVKRVSKPGRRVYTGSGKLPRILSGYGTSVVSTSKGVMTSKQARAENIGGEVLFSIW